jgi:HAD superfamily hydrolase (TIGR01509 family)
MPPIPLRNAGGRRFRGSAVTRAVLLDLDDTLFDHRHGARQALAAVRESHSALAGLDPAELERRHALILEAIHLRVLANEIGLDDARLERFRRLFESAGVPAHVNDVALVQQAASTYRDCYMRSRREVQGATALLRALRSRARVGIVSNNLAREQYEKLRFCGFDAHLDAIVISEEAGVSKPDPAIFRLALERIGVDAEEAVMVGDAWHTDIAGARAAGLRAIWFNPHGSARPEPWADVEEIRALEPASAVLSVIFGNEDGAEPSDA